MNPFILTAWIACQVLDGSTTTIGLNRNAIEKNPSLTNKGIAIKISANAFIAIVSKKETRKQRNIVGSAFALSGCIVSGSNLYQLNK